MESISITIIIIIILILLKLVIDYNIDEFNNYENNNTNPIILNNDLNYYKKFYKSKKMDSLINNNKINSPNNKKNKILFITYDNRENQDYLFIHNSNINEYVNKYNYEYKYYNYCDKNVYWCKIYFVLEALKTNKYDYVVWLDSDTVIKNFNIDIGNIFNMFSSSIFIGSDNNLKYGLINAGVFAISNSEIGKNFLSECIEYINEDCFNNDGTLKGKWAGTCYEQGIMNILIHDKYYLYTTVLTNKVIFNYNVCSNDVFIMHLYASSSDSRVSCFQSSIF
jgi:hypothetical protein